VRTIQLVKPFAPPLLVLPSLLGWGSSTFMKAADATDRNRNARRNLKFTRKIGRPPDARLFVEAQLCAFLSTRYGMGGSR
jgi:hypothetical protein